MMIGGKDEEKQDSVEVVSRLGSCLMPDGHPAQLPVGRTGHVAVLAGKSKQVWVSCNAKKLILVLNSQFDWHKMA